jgi:hypothetical protein
MFKAQIRSKNELKNLNRMKDFKSFAHFTPIRYSNMKMAQNNGRIINVFSLETAQQKLKTEISKEKFFKSKMEGGNSQKKSFFNCFKRPRDEGSNIFDDERPFPLRLSMSQE